MFLARGRRTNRFHISGSNVVTHSDYLIRHMLDFAKLTGSGAVTSVRSGVRMECVNTNTSSSELTEGQACSLLAAHAPFAPTVITARSTKQQKNLELYLFKITN